MTNPRLSTDHQERVVKELKELRDKIPEHLQATSKPFAVLAEHMATTLPDGPEKSAGLRKLLEAKDCAVRAALP